MPLIEATLKAGILNVFTQNTNSKGKDPKPPAIPDQVAQALADAYDKYALGAKAVPPLTQVTPGVVAGLAKALVAPSMAGWAPGLLAYWSPVTYGGPGFIPVNPVAPSVGALSGISAEINDLFFKNLTNSKASADEVAGKIAGILHKYTTMLMITATTTSVPPVVTQMPVS